MKIQFTIEIELPDQGFTEEQVKVFSESLRREMHSKQYGLKRSSYERAYEKAKKAKQSALIIGTNGETIH